MELRRRALGMALGIVWGLGVFAATIWAVVLGQGATLSLLKAYYLGYDVSYLGAFVGLVWGFVDGFIAGVLIACFYGLFCKILYKSEVTAV